MNTWEIRCRPAEFWRILTFLPYSEIVTNEVGAAYLKLQA